MSNITNASTDAPTDRENIWDDRITDKPMAEDRAVAKNLSTMANSAQAERITGEDFAKAGENYYNALRRDVGLIESGKELDELLPWEKDAAILDKFLLGDIKLAEAMEELPILDDKTYDNLVCAVRDKVLGAFNLACHSQGILDSDQISSEFQEAIVNEVERTKQFMEQTRAAKLKQAKETVVNIVRERI